MAKTTLCDISDGNLQASLGSFFRSMLEKCAISALMAPLRQSGEDLVMQTLITDSSRTEDIDALAPSFPMNAARLVSRLTRKSGSGKIAVLLRPCEIRAYIELVKLNQGSVEDVIIAGIDCPGAFKNTDYKVFAAKYPGQSTDRFLRAALSGETSFEDGIQLSPACRACTKPVADGADLSIGIFGIDIEKQFLLTAQTEKGEAVFDSLGLSAQQEPARRQEAVKSLLAARENFKNEMVVAAREKTHSPEKLASYLSNCINCYNCRVACPVCYCRECVFVTDVFDHDPYQYLRWAGRKGKIRMPTDTVFYHITRMAHMSTACVGCGQCSNACPNDIPLAELFITTAVQTQEAFDYEPGRSLDEDPPLSVFYEDEFNEVVEIKH